MDPSRAVATEVPRVENRAKARDKADARAKARDKATDAGMAAVTDADQARAAAGSRTSAGADPRAAGRAASPEAR